MEHLPRARVVPQQPLARLRAAAGRAHRALARAWNRIARQALVLSLTALGFVVMLAGTLALAQHAITVRPVVDPPLEQPMVIYFMHAPTPHTVHAALTTIRPAEVASSQHLVDD